MKSPVFLAVKPYMGAQNALRAGRFALFGAPFDSTTSFRPGSREGPAMLRIASEGLEDYCPLWNRTLGDRPFSDLGDVELPIGDPKKTLDTLYAASESLLNRGAVPFLLGGEHLVSLPLIQAQARRHPDLCLVHLDAHADLREGYLGVPLSHSAVIRHALRDLSPDRLFQFGIRSGTREEWDTMRHHGTLYEGDEAGLQAALQKIGSRPVHLTLDLDILDPSGLPGTGTPEPGGWSFVELDRFLRGLLSRVRLVGADVVELAPPLDPFGVSSVVAAKVVRTILLGASFKAPTIASPSAKRKTKR